MKADMPIKKEKKQYDFPYCLPFAIYHLKHNNRHHKQTFGCV